MAQTASQEQVEIGESGTAYLRTTRFRGVDTDVAYFDPNNPPPPLDTKEEPRERSERASRQVDLTIGERSFYTVISVVLIAGFAYLLWRFGGGVSVSFRDSSENAKTKRRGAGGKVAKGPVTPRSLQAILQMKDRREALVALSRTALARAVEAQGVLWQRSWTERDALRRIPQGQAYRDALRALVLASERVHFGGRDVTEDEFRDHVSGVRPLYAEPQS